jgi:D-alanyl-lipoteichoic acid acyltransferase DltB (MBOAT superfamily)
VLFNSYSFLFLFLPVTIVGFFAVARYSRPLAGLWLFSASLFFYGWWNPAYVGLLLASVVFNYAVGRVLVRERSHDRRGRRRLVLAVGVAANLGLLAYYKYANFFVANFTSIVDLPGISIRSSCRWAFHSLPSRRSPSWWTLSAAK